jgi:endonuclease/exonuclease/phosphatase family metal-dependent hydrolase
LINQQSNYFTGRAQNIEQLLADQQFQRFVQLTEKEPLIVAGDFNCPSHQDWIQETKLAMNQ